MTTSTLQKTYNDALKMLQNNAFAEAETLLSQALLIHEGDLNCERLLGMTFLRQERFPEAIKIFKGICTRVEDSPLATLDLVMAYQADKQPAQAITLLQDTLKQSAHLVPLWYKLGDLLFEADRLPDAQKAYKTAEKKDPFRDQIDTAKNAINHGEHPKAEQIFRQVLSQDGEHIEALVGLAALAIQSTHHQDAEHLFATALKRSLYWPIGLAGRAELFLKTGRAQDAGKILMQALTIAPKNPIFWAMYSTALEMQMKFDESLAASTKSLKLQPNQPHLILGLGHYYRIIGDREKSIRLYKQHIEMAQFQGEGYAGLADLKTYVFSDQEVADMKEATKVPNAPPPIYAQLHFALARAFESRKEFDQSFGYYEKANDIMQAWCHYSPDQVTQEIDAIIAGYDADFLATANATESTSSAPIFILGMPRTGSTLLEQILASHSEVDATMELPFLSRYVEELTQLGDRMGGYPQNIRSIAPVNFKRLHERFLKTLEVYRHGGAYFIDKMPNNFLHIGLIHVMFPNAKIIDMRRDPMDTCFSLYKQFFFSGQLFSYDQQNLGHFYQQYIKIMDHWNEALPGRILTVHYESLVAKPETEIKRILDHCGLAFEAACLEPHLTKRAIRTASSEQVRQPITTDNVGYWHNYERHLVDLELALGDQFKK